MATWLTANGGEICYGCGEEQEEGDEYQLVNGKVYCEPCVEDSEAFDDEYYDDDDYLIDGVGFADSSGKSALRAATPTNPRDQPCPQCGAQDVLTPIDVSHHYVCDRCADQNEGGY